MKKKIIWFIVLYIVYLPVAMFVSFMIPALLNIPPIFPGVVLCILFLGGPIIYFSLTYDKPGKAEKQILLSGIEAIAQLNYVKDTGITMNGFNRVVVLGLTVFGNGENFEAEAESQYNKYMLPRPGDKIKVKYDPSNKTKLVVL